jgi:TetR/AcrR family transcriptional regulator, cholesterol catabolism regulator
MEVLADVDKSLVQDLENILSSLVYGLLGRFAADEIDITEILPTLDRAVLRLTSSYESTASSS